MKNIIVNWKQDNTYNYFKINIIKDIFLRTINSIFNLKDGKKDLYNNEQIFLHKKGWILIYWSK